LLKVIADRTTGTAEDVAVARARRNLVRSEQIRSKSFRLNAKRAPVEMSVAPANANGPGFLSRSSNVAPLEQDLVVVIGRHVRSPGGPADELVPVERIEGAPHQRALHVALEESLLVL
jgi:hypothetical protein